MIISEKSFVGYSSVKREEKKIESSEIQQLSQKEIKERIKLAHELHNKRAKNIRDRFSNLPVFQAGGALENLVVFK